MMVYNVYYEILYSIMGHLYLLEGLYKKPRLKNEFIIKYYRSYNFALFSYY